MAEIDEEPSQDNGEHVVTELCRICLDPMGPFNNTSSVKPPCCLNGWFHKTCLEKFAKNAGIEFRCPICMNENIFCKKMKRLGIEAPMR